jgi:hypothetical protein
VSQAAGVLAAHEDGPAGASGGHLPQDSCIPELSPDFSSPADVAKLQYTNYSKERMMRPQGVKPTWSNFTRKDTHAAFLNTCEFFTTPTLADDSLNNT